jgi:hypothetical protein
MSLPFRLADSGEPVVTVQWVEQQLVPALGMMLSGRVDLARQHVSDTLHTLTSITDALRASTDCAGEV